MNRDNRPPSFPVCVGIFSFSVLSLIPEETLAEQDHSPSHALQRVEDPEEGRHSGDGVYGRFDGDMSYRLGLGAELSFDNTTFRPLVVAGLTAYQTLGIYTSFRKGLAEDDARVALLSFGLSLSPLFLLRWQQNAASGQAFWDLTLDSLALTLGAHLDQAPGEHFASDIGFEGGLEFGVPLAARAAGPWLRCRGNFLTGEQPDGTIWLYLAWEGFFHLGLLPVD